jgi:hypothetical protein
MSQAPFDPFDPVNMAMRALHQGNLNAAKDAKEKNLVYAGNELARVMDDLLGSDMITCQISRAVMTATLAKWNRAKGSQE